MASEPAQTKEELKQEEELMRLDAEIARAKKYKEILEEENRALETVYTWKAPERLFKPKAREWYVTMAGASILVIVLGALTNNFGLIFAVIALTLFVYALNTIPPREVTHEITNKGVKTQGLLYLWGSIVSFWVLKREGEMFIHFDTIEKQEDLPKRLILLKGNGDLNFIVSYLVEHVDYLSSKEVSQGWFGKMILGEYQPLLPFLEGKHNVKTKDPKDTPQKKSTEENLPK
ncbi:hypothetical protein H3C67_01030 [Candidatus Dojkabacteria bacterium]|uniref:DUF5673 domain-containing protein n=1 Tax=Candidatus Dojkabacteria bacterium TaxID=2099670 RepID=A0A952AGA5_9BACT|nr:hypothetical protein [Candidatus Dojkabacteria bacterium]